MIHATHNMSNLRGGGGQHYIPRHLCSPVPIPKSAGAKTQPCLTPLRISSVSRSCHWPALFSSCQCGKTRSCSAALNPPIIKIDEIQLEPISNFNFLGIIINENINWSKHINKISYSISKTIGIIRKLKNVLPSSVLLTIYNSLILPQLTYGILVWGYESNCIFKLQKMALRAMTSSKYNAHTNPMFKKMHLLKVGDIHTVQQLIFF